MSLTVNSYIVADPRVQHVHLQQLLGAYELFFTIAMKVNSRQKESNARWMRLESAGVRVKSASTDYQDLGRARPAQPAIIRQNDFVNDATVQMSLGLQPHQLGRLEDRRNSEDLEFELAVIGVGGVLGVDQFDGQVFDTLRITVSRSDWIKRLREVAAFDILLVEIPMPFVGASETQRKAIEHLRTAQKYFIEGHYTACVAACREVFDSFGIRPSALKPLASASDQMSKDERTSAMFAAMRHYTHSAHHASSPQVQAVYDRADAKLLLQLGAAVASYENQF